MNVAVCDDEITCVETVNKFLDPYVRAFPRMQVRSYLNAEVFYRDCMQNGDVDLVFLDIEMGGANGIEIARKVKQRLPNIIIIFISSHSSYVSDAFDLRAFQYLVKPITKDQFEYNLARAFEEYNNTKISLVVAGMGTDLTGKFRIIFSSSEIIYLESSNKQVKVFTTKGEYLYYGKLDDIEKQLKGTNFIRCHKSYLVNAEYVRKAYKESVVLKNDDINIPISYTFRDTTLLAIKAFVEEHL